MRLTWHDYNYYPYERELAAREIASLLGKNEVRQVADGIELGNGIDCAPAGRLTYFSGAVGDGSFVPTVQARLEQPEQNGKKRQATRYSVHGLHEYKGKFNPQVARALLNIFGIESRQRVLDPFCGSGTTLVECAHLGATGVGVDINPLAVTITQAKLHALSTPVEQLREAFKRLVKLIHKAAPMSSNTWDDPRTVYLNSWFDPNVLAQIEWVRSTIEESAPESRLVFLAIASNLLRDYSLQDPKDLRTRRRKSPLPETPFSEALVRAVPPFLQRVESTQAVLGTDLPQGTVLLGDVNGIATVDVGRPFDAAVTSPPYAMALPYIDTQRLSLVWLELLKPNRILELESGLIGSREFRGSTRRLLLERLRENADGLPIAQHNFCVELNDALAEEDGFRRQAVPILLYRYFASMKASFGAVKLKMKPTAPFGLIVGHNHTVIGGVRREIDTPAHLAALATAEGWQVKELIPLQTYRRYGYHAGNAVGAETLILLCNA